MADQKQQEVGGPGTAVVERAAPRGIEGAIGLLKPVAAIDDIVKNQDETRKLIHKALKRDRDYGVIPGTDKPALYKPGAERICVAYGVVARYRLEASEIDHDREVPWDKTKMVWDQDEGRKVPKTTASGVSRGLYRHVIVCELYVGDRVVGEGIGSCSTLESKYVDRPRDLENTVLKMAKKRAYVDAVLTTFGLSDEFTQDREEDEDDGEAQAARREQAQKQAAGNVRGGVQKAMERLDEIQKGKGKGKKAPTPAEQRAEEEQANKLFGEISENWDRRGVPDLERMDEARVALIGDDVERFPDNGVPNIEVIPSWALQKILDHITAKEAAKAPPPAAGDPKLL